MASRSDRRSAPRCVDLWHGCLKLRHPKDQDRLLTFQMLGQQQPWCFPCQPDHGHPRSEPLNGEDELCAQRTRVVLDVDRSLSPRWAIALPTVGMRGSSSGMSGISASISPSSAVGRSRCFQSCQSATIAEHGEPACSRCHRQLKIQPCRPNAPRKITIAVMMASTRRATRRVPHPLRRCWTNTCVGGCCGGG